MENSETSYQKYIKKSFFKSLDADEREKYLGYIKNMHSLIIDLVANMIKEKNDIFADKTIENFVLKLVDIKKYIDLDEWKYYIIDTILERPGVEYSEIKVTEYINYLFDKHKENR